jgi:voltage-gated potassium channel
MTETLDLHFDQIRIAAGSSLDGQKIREANIRSDYDVMLVAITPAQGAMIFNPIGEQELHAGDLLIAIGNRAGLRQLAKVAAAQGTKA